MREIKFRVWDKELKKWSDIPLEYAIKDIALYTDYEWCQFTGKFDIRGNEIYEGDIVRFQRREGEVFIGEIAYIEEYGAYFVIHSGISDNQLYAFSQYEVIGNIFENPELLEDEW